MGCVEAAWFKPEGSESDTETDSRWEVGAAGDDNFTTETESAWVGSRVEVEFGVSSNYRF